MASKVGPGIKSEEEPHATHSIEWSFSSLKKYNIDCNKAGTVLEVLKRSPEFIKKIIKHNKQELVILTGGRAISSHFPCSLIKNKLTLTFMKASDPSGSYPGQCASSSESHLQKPSQRTVAFNVWTKGNSGITKIMKNPELKKKCNEVTVYGYVGETIKQALRRDGRFHDRVFEKNCALQDTTANVTKEMSGIVDNLEGDTFRIFLLDFCQPPNSQPSSQDESFCMDKVESTERQVSQSPSQKPFPTNTESKSPTRTDGGSTPTNGEEKAQNELCEKLNAQFKDVIKNRKGATPKLSRIQNLFRVQFGKNAESCREVRIMKELMVLSDSVCQVRIRSSAEGTGFLLFEGFVLTNAHVIKNAYNETMRMLLNPVTVHFSFESLGEVGEEHKVTEVVACDFNELGDGCDWALLKLEPGQTGKKGLLSSFGFLLEGGGISIIGHPDGHVKKIDPCVVLQNEEQARAKAVHENPQNLHLITPLFFDNVKKDLEQRKVKTYETCFYHGSSGSPVFDQYCKVVAVHSGGYPYNSPNTATQSLMEYGYPLSNVIECLMIQLVEKEKFDVLQTYLNTCCRQHDIILANVKKLVESRNLTVFKNSIKKAIVDPRVKDIKISKMLDFFNHEEKPVPMEH